MEDRSPTLSKTTTGRMRQQQVPSGVQGAGIEFPKVHREHRKKVNKRNSLLPSGGDYGGRKLWVKDHMEDDCCSRFLSSSLSVPELPSVRPRGPRFKHEI